jgi:hypothetical protein
MVFSSVLLLLCCFLPSWAVGSSLVVFSGGDAYVTDDRWSDKTARTLGTLDGKEQGGKRITRCLEEGVVEGDIVGC